MKDELSTYVQHCKVVVRDIDYVMADRKLQADNWTIRYAVDFSEIFSYTLPFKNPETAPMADGWAEDALQQFYVVSRFFARKEIILLEPYALELRGHLDNLMTESYDESAELLLLAMKDLKTLLTSDGAASEVMMLALESADRKLSGDEAKRAIAFFEEQAPSLVAYVRGADLPPLARLKRLLRLRPFIDIESLAPGAAGKAVKENIEKIAKYLTARRQSGRPGSDYLDALAIEQVRCVNQDLEPRKIRLLLVARSLYMMRAVEQYATDLGMPRFVRHPRIFAAAYTPEGGHSRQSLADLSLRRESLQIFINSVDRAFLHSYARNAFSTGSDGDGRASDAIVNLQSSLEKIKHDSSSVESLSSAFVAEGELPLTPKDPQVSPRRTAHKLLEYLRDKDRNICRYAVKHIRKIIDDVRRERDRLGVKLQSTVTQTELGNILYPIEFETPTLRECVEELARHWSVGVEGAASLVECAAESSASEYEQLLAMAVSLGIIGRWDVAAKYSDYALHIGRDSKTRLHEGYFWYAVCLRKNSGVAESPVQSIERIKKALESIETARVARREAVDSSDDPRYLKEEAALLLEWRQMANSPENESLRDSSPSPRTVEEKLKTALAVAQDPKLLVQIHNAFCYLYISEDDRENTEKYLKLLEESLQPYHPVVPSFIKDTIVWGQFKLAAEQASASQLEGFLDSLDAITRSLDLTSFEKDMVRMHRITVSGQLARKKKVAAELDPATGLPRMHL